MTRVELWKARKKKSIRLIRLFAWMRKAVANGTATIVEEGFRHRGASPLTIEQMQPADGVSVVPAASFEIGDDWIVRDET